MDVSFLVRQSIIYSTFQQLYLRLMFSTGFCGGGFSLVAPGKWSFYFFITHHNLFRQSEMFNLSSQNFEILFNDLVLTQCKVVFNDKNLFLTISFHRRNRRGLDKRSTRVHLIEFHFLCFLCVT